MPEAAMERTELNYANLSKKFICESPNFSQQYSGIYLVRLKTMNKILESEARKKWHNTYPIHKLHELSAQNNTKCIVIGTLFKDQKLKPSILKQMAKGNQLLPQPVSHKFTDQSDKLYVEDDLQRYLLLGSIPGSNLVTGITCALLGVADDKGRFQVDDWVFANFRPQVPRPTLTASVYVLFMSGLNILDSADCYDTLQLLVNWLASGLAQVSRVIIVGNIVRNAVEETEPCISILSRKKEPMATFEAVKVVDDFLLKLAQMVEIDVMPGANDPSNNILPQQPMHHCMFPKSASFKSLNHVSNPYFCSLAGVKLLGTSGQPVKDILAFSDISEPLDVLENCLKWDHLAPTCPDTLGCMPVNDEDPFVIEECPHVFFAGNQAKFATREVEGPEGQKVRLICVPEFTTTFEVAMLDLKSLECRSYVLKANHLK